MARLDNTGQKLDRPPKRWRYARVLRSGNSTEPCAVYRHALSTNPVVTMTADLHSVPVALLQREIEKIARRINGSTSKDDIDRAYAILYRLQEARALASERTKAFAD